MIKMIEEDARLIHEAQRRFDDFISEPERTDIWCHHCETYGEQGRIPTKDVMIVARCNCRTAAGNRRVEAVLMSEYKKLDQDDWDRIINAI